ncbi:MAG: hypothetical protein ACJAZO_000456 [Myxococcota bacterium]|jgi:hypothetical protein
MADKSPKKQAPTVKLSTKEKQDRKKAKKAGKAAAGAPIPSSKK